MINILPATRDDLSDITEIYNYYVTNTAVTFDVSAFTTDERIPWYEEHSAPFGLWSIRKKNSLIGYSSLSRYKPKPAYDSTAEVSIYLHPDHTGHGYGKIILEDLVNKAEQAGFNTLLSLITSNNSTSLALHEKCGFFRCGEIKEAGKKLGNYHSVTFMQKIL